MSSPLESYCSSAFPLDTDVAMRSSIRSKSPFRRRKKNTPCELMKQSEIVERKRSFFEDPGLFETSAIEVVLDIPPEKPRKEPPATPHNEPPVTPRKEPPAQVEEQRTPETTGSSCSDETPPEIKREDLKRKTFKQKFMQKKADPSPPKVTSTNRTTCTSSTKTTSRDGNEDQRNPLETSRRCFPFSVHSGVADRSRGRSLSRGRISKNADSEKGKEITTTGKVTTPLRRRARSMSRRAAAVPPNTKTTTPSKVSSAACLLKKNRSNTSKLPLMEPHMRASTEDEEAVFGDENPDPKIEARLCMRPRLLARLQDHEPPRAPSVSPSRKGQQQQQYSESIATPRSIILARQKSMFSEISTPSDISGPHLPQHPVVQRMEQSLVEATRSGKKIDRMLVYQTLFQIADSLESPEEQAAMQRELALLLQHQEPTPTAVPQDTFSPQLSETLGPACSPSRSMASRTGSRFSRASGISKGHCRAKNIANAKNSDELSDDGFTEWAEDLDSQSTGSSSTDDTMNFISEMFNFRSFFSKDSGDGKDMRDDEDVGEDEDDDVEVPESWNNFQPPPNVVRSKPGTRLSRRRSRPGRRNSKNAPGDKGFEGTRPVRRGVSKSRRDVSPDRDRRAWWRKKDDVPHAEMQTRGHRERSMLQEEDNLSLSSIDSQQYCAFSTRRPVDFAYDGRRQRSKSTDDRRTMLM